MSTLQKLSELEARRFTIQNGSSDEAKKVVLAKDKLTARDRLSHLFDENSFVEIGTFMKSRSTAFNMDVCDTPADGVVCGYGMVKGTRVYAYSQDVTVLGGAIGEMHAQKIAKTYDDAIKMGAPIVGFLDTVGLRLQESIDALDGYGAIFAKMTQASGVIPQIAVVCGTCAGGASFIAGLSDFTFISTKNGQMFLNSPNTLEDKNTSFDSVASPSVHLEESGIATFGEANEEALIGKVVELLGYLPNNNQEDVPCYACQDDLNRTDANLNAFDFGQGKVVEIIKQVADEHTYLELSKAYGTNASIGFIRLNGATVGVVANQEEVMDYDALQKITRFIHFCDAFNIAIVTFTNVKRFESTVATEKLGIIKEASKMVHAFVEATVPKVNIILNAACGTAYVTMNSKHVGADYVYAWPTADVTTMNSESAVKIMYNEEIQKSDNPVALMQEKIQQFEQTNSVYGMAARGYIDDIIEPAATRKRIIATLENLITKQVVDTFKKHPTV